MAGEERLTGAKGKLVLFLADGTTLDIPLDRERVTVGRRAGNDVCLPYAAVSAAHAVFVATPTAVVIEDLGSTNGTMINGKRMSRQVVRDGDRIEIGRQQMVYLADDSASLPPAPARARSSRGADDRNGAGEPATRPVAGTPSAGTSSEAPPPAPPAFDGPVLKVLTGPRTGRMLALTKPEVLIGRAGVQVAAARQAGDAYRLYRGEGVVVPRINGVPVPPEGMLLHPGDAIEVADTQVVFLQGTDATAH